MTVFNAPTVALLGSVICTSDVFFGHLSELHRGGVIQLINGRLKPNYPIDTETRVKAFAGYLPLAGRSTIGLSVLSAIASFTAAYTAHNDAVIRATLGPARFVPRLALASGVLSLLVGPLTFALGIPKINSELFAISRSSSTQIQEKSGRVDELLKQWESKHLVRYISYAGAWALALSALVLRTAV